MKTVPHADPRFAAMRDKVRAAGTDSLSYFGNGYTHEGGLYLQQNPDEFAALALLLKDTAPIGGAYLEIGSASGGAAVFLHREVGFSRVLSIDDGNHPRATAQAVHFGQIECLTRYTGDSHSDDVRIFLRDTLVEPIDVAFIDGDHSYEGVTKDIELVLPFARRGALIVLHDIVACEGVKQAWVNLLGSARTHAVAEFVGDEGPLGIGVAEVV